MNTNYRFSTPDHDFVIVPNPVVPDLIEVRCEHRDGIEEFIETLELAGVAEGESFENLIIEEDMTEETPFFYTEVSTATLVLYTSFEFLNYMGATINA